MKIAPFLLCAQISCALVAALDGILSEGVKVSELFDRSQLAAENGYQVGYGQKGLPKRLWRREDQQSQLEKRSIETEQEDTLTEGAKDKWTLFSEGLNTRERWVEVEKRSGGVFKRDDPQTAASVMIGKFELKEEHLLAFIVGKEYKNQVQCKTKLEKYCEKLKKADKNLTLVHPLLSGICNDTTRDGKCKDLEQKIKPKVQALKDELQKLDAKVKNPSQLANDECKKHEPECFFLDGTDDDLKKKCNGLGNACYKMKRNKVAEKFLLALKGNLKKGNDVKCKESLTKQCSILSRESDELMLHCLDPEKACQELIKKVESDSKALKDEIPKVTNDDGKLQSQCSSLLEKCFLYKEDSQEKDLKTECEKLEGKCKEKNITYAPPKPPFSPIEQAPGLLEEIGLEELHKESASKGVFIGKSWKLDEIEFLALVVSSHSSGNAKKEYEDECKDKLKNNCKNYKSFPGKIKELCQNDKASGYGEGECTNLSKNIQNKCKSLKIMLESKGAIDNGDPSTIYIWKELEITYLRERECAELESQCLYLEKHCQSHNLGNGCQNLRAACYKRALYDLAYVELQKKLRGELSSRNAYGYSAQDDPNNQKKLLEKCKELGNQSIELFQLCIDPETTLDSLRQDIFHKAHILKPALDDKRDFPSEKDCLTLQKQCEHLEADSYLVEEACHTLRTRCQFRSLSEDLKLRLLEKRDGTLKNETTCTHKLGIECSRWNRRWKNPFAFPCALRDDSCKLMTQRVEDHCNAFEENLEERKIAENANKPQQQEEICLQWTPYCDTLLPNCEDKNNKTKESCEKLKTNCKEFLKKWELEEELMKELQGNLNNNCTKTLAILCTPVKNLTNPKSSNLSSLCKGEKKGDDQVRKDLCDKLIKRIQKRCPLLKIKLDKAKNEVEEMHKDYEKIKEKAEKAFKESAVIVSAALKEEKKIVQRDVKSTETSKQEPMSVLITEKEVDAIDLSARAMSLYMELKDMCKPLLLDCGFKGECKDCQDACKTIEAKCTSIKAPEVKPPAVIEKECKPEAGKEGKGSESKPTGEGKSSGGASKPSKPEAAGEKKCDPVKTVDKWTTTTSTYTTTTTSTKTTTLKVTLTSTRKCKPTKCTTGKPESTKGSDEEEVVPSGGKRWLPSVGIAIVGVAVAIM